MISEKLTAQPSLSVRVTTTRLGAYPLRFQIPLRPSVKYRGWCLNSVARANSVKRLPADWSAKMW